MADLLDLALGKLKENGFKITLMREKVLREMLSNSIPVTPYEMKDNLAKTGFKADVVTLYRVFEVLENLGLIHKISSLGRYVICHLEEEKSGCHHYVVCRLCKKIQEIEGEDLSRMEVKIKKNLGFKVEGHYLEFSGVCDVCVKMQNNVDENQDIGYGGSGWDFEVEGN